MMKTREELENLINNSVLFDIDSTIDFALYKAERSKFLTSLTDYYRFYIFPHKPLEDYSYTLIETALECIKYYAKGKGEFLHLFNNAFKRDLSIARAKERIDEYRQGIRFSDNDQKLINKVLSFVKTKNLDIYDADVQVKIANIIGVSVDKIIEIVRMNDNATVVEATVTNDDGEIELYDIQADKSLSQEDDIISRDNFDEILTKIDDTFQCTQQRQRRMLSLLLTVEVIKALDYDIESALNICQGYKFFNGEVIVLYRENGDLPSAKAIGEICGVSEQSLSRTYRNFKEKLTIN